MAHETFFKQLTLAICSSLDIETALFKGFLALREKMPADGLSFDLDQPDGTLVSIARATPQGVDLTDIPVPLSSEGEKEACLNKGFFDVMIFNAPDLNPISKDFARQLKIGEASYLVLGLNLDKGWSGGLALHALGRHRYKASHARLLSEVKQPLSMAMSNALRHRELLLESARIRQENRSLYQELIHGGSHLEVVGKDGGLKPVMEMASQVAGVDSPVLLLGETGVGKDVIANAIHLMSPRRKGPIVRVNCGAIPEHLMDAELFGHEKGAFTGAVREKRGRFERAHQGTLFLDEVGELKPEAQIRLLRAIQFQEIERVGGTRSIPVDVRIIAATHRDLETLILSGRFREDLFYRLNVFPISIPPLRRRKEDIPDLVAHLLETKARDLKQSPPPGLLPGALDRLLSYDWPGNIRELSNIIERALILSPRGPLSFEGLTGGAAGCFPQPREPDTGGEAALLPLDEMIAAHIKSALIQTRGRVEGPKGAAQILKIHPNTLRSKIKKLNIKFKRG